MANCGSFVVGTVLFILNLFWLILSSILIYIGTRMLIWQSDFKSLEQLADITFTTVATFLLVLAILCAFTSFLGLCGICCRNSCSLKIFGFLILGLIALEISAVVLTNKDRNLAEKFENATRDAIKQLNNNGTMNDLTEQFQYYGQCCGFDGPQDYNATALPKSCCGYNPSSTMNETCPSADTKSHPVAAGCKEKISYVTTLFGNAFNLSVAIILFELIIVLAACCLAKEYQLEDAGVASSII